MAIIDNYSKEELKQIVKQSKSLKEVIDKSIAYYSNRFLTVELLLPLWVV